MKRFVIFLMIAALLGFGSLGVSAGSNGTTAAGASASHLQWRQIFRQRRWRPWLPRHNRNTSVRYETRIVHKGNKVYRDTYRITWKNGYEQVKRVDRVRIR
jgi:hypothetical protein